MVVAVDSAVDLLQERLLEVSDEITRELSRLEHNIDAVPAEGRASLLMAARPPITFLVHGSALMPCVQPWKC